VTRAARSLGMHRNQLRRWIARHNVDPKGFDTAEEGGSSETADERPSKS